MKIRSFVSLSPFLSIFNLNFKSIANSIGYKLLAATITLHSKYVRGGPSFKNPTASRIAAQYQAMPDPRNTGNNLAAIDPFYGPILTKIDTIFAQLGVNDEPCKERLLCSMYKNPTQYSPHSNFISAELSRWVR